MNVLVVYAHHEPTSFTAALKNVVLQELTHQQHTIEVSDLYGQGFNPVAQKWDFTQLSGKHFNYMLEQKFAAQNDLAYSPDLVSEIQKVREAQLLILVTPIWWFSVPAILKGWFDRVLTMGVAWDGGKIYEQGLFKGKQAFVVVNAGGPAEYYQPNGKHKTTMNDMLHPINHGTLAFCGMDVHEPFVAINVMGEPEEAREQQLNELRFRMQNLLTSPLWLSTY